MKTRVSFINHSAVIISAADVRILCDPWFEGDAFHKGWNLIYENDPTYIEKILDNITHIWISHEHPDHFSVRFFGKYKEIVKQKKIIVLFQLTRDRRVHSFLNTQGILVQELEDGQKTPIGFSGVSVTCYCDGFYDSALLFEYDGERVLNLNDCEISTYTKAALMATSIGRIDILLTQFSYAAWKGGAANMQWRQEAAASKLETMQIQINAFKPRFVIPFASYIFFSNQLNKYLNDSINTPKRVADHFLDSKTPIVIMQPYDCFKGHFDRTKHSSALTFWDEHYSRINTNKFHEYASRSFEELEKSFLLYRTRIRNNNNFLFMRFLRFMSPIPILKPAVLYIHDLEINVSVDIFHKKLEVTSDKAHLSLHSESLYFLFNNSFGFDTLTVNGCFEEIMPRGFVTATKTLAIENLNNLGIKISPYLLMNFRIIAIFMAKLFRVRKKLSAQIP